MLCEGDESEDVLCEGAGVIHVCEGEDVMCYL